MAKKSVSAAGVGGTDNGRGQSRRSTAPLLEKIVRLSLSASAVDIASYEQYEVSPLRAELVPLVTEILDDALGFFDRILDTHGGDEETSLGKPAEEGHSFRREVDELLLGEIGEHRDGLGERISDLAFIARLELRQKSAGLTRLPADSDSWRIIAAGGSCLRQIQKALAALEAVITRAEGLKPVLGFHDELALSLVSRRAYADFRRQLRAVARLPGISDRLQGAATSIADLFDLEIYRDFRISDRVQLRRLLERILRWAGPEADRQGGERIWQDLLGCAALLAEISKRQELEEHDERVCREILDRLVVASSPGPDLPHDVRPLVESLTGRDDDLDDRIFEGRIDFGTAAAIAQRFVVTRSRPAPRARD
jgi:hypothetical protein